MIKSAVFTGMALTIVFFTVYLLTVFGLFLSSDQAQKALEVMGVI